MYETAILVITARTEKQDDTAEGSSSEEEHMEDALASGADEGRDKLR